MGAFKQHTLESPVEFSGVGLHTGETCRAVVQPAPAGAGISFRRKDISVGDNIVVAAPENIVLTNHGTVLGNKAGVTVATVEHIMAALSICELDNVTVDVDGPEVPILDGSAALFVGALKSAGVKGQGADRDIIVIEEAISVSCPKGRSIYIEPHDSFVVDVMIDFEDCLIGRQTLSMHFEKPEDYERLARSRTFCRLHEVEGLRSMGLIRGGSLDNSLVVDGDKILNEEALRDPEEFVLHKALDLLGDLYLLGAPIRGRVRAEKPGHDLNARMALAIARRYGLLEREQDDSRLFATG
jgi:UDP-3-O-[3-hydroxymyristoyl] N-acetylglucosamine deacetylase